MAELLVDTDVLVDHLRRGHSLEPVGDQLHYSTISRAELFAGRATEEDVVARLLAPLVEHGVDTAISEAGGRIRRASGLALPDALIAASALLSDLPLLTRNRRHFERVEGLAVQSPP